MKELNKIISLILILTMLCGNTLYAQNAAQPKTLKGYVERAKRDNVTFEKKGIDGRGLLSAGIITLVSSYALKAVFGKGVKAEMALLQSNMAASQNLLQDAAIYATETGDSELRNLLVGMKNSAPGTYIHTLSAIEVFEIKKNLATLNTMKNLLKAIPGNDYAQAYALLNKSIMELEWIVMELKAGRLTDVLLVQKEAIYKVIDMTKELKSASPIRLRREIFNTANSGTAIRATRVYINKDLLAAEKTVISKINPARMKAFRLLNKFFIAAVLLVAVTSASAQQQRVERITNNVELILDADDQTILLIEKNKELADIIKLLLDNHHEAAVGTADKQAEYKKEFETKKKQINFTTRNNKFSSSGAKTGK
ncbi:hypothetical protein AAIR98_001127 [Elusimicrobium simillimum]|uniref:hypothetical protein n=1 Tax=Elusimicrobium simillimum TaxID=3143438 RepID=UPI003C6EDDC0